MVIIEALKEPNAKKPQHMVVGEKYTVGLELAEKLVEAKRAKILKKLYVEPEKD